MLSFQINQGIYNLLAKRSGTFVVKLAVFSIGGQLYKSLLLLRLSLKSKTNVHTTQINDHVFASSSTEDEFLPSLHLLAPDRGCFRFKGQLKMISFNTALQK